MGLAIAIVVSRSRILGLFCSTVVLYLQKTSALIPRGICIVLVYASLSRIYRESF